MKQDGQRHRKQMKYFQFTCEKRKSYKCHPFNNKGNIDIHKTIKRQKRANKDYMPHEGLTTLLHHGCQKNFEFNRGPSGVRSFQFLFQIR